MCVQRSSLKATGKCEPTPFVIFTEHTAEDDVQDQNEKWIKETQWVSALYKNKLIDIHRLSCPIFSDAKSQCAHGNNAKRYIITAALLNFCGWSGTELLSGRETWEGGLEILSRVNIWLELQHDPLWVKLHIYRRCTSDDTHTAHGCVKPWHPLDIIKLSPLVLGAIILCDLLGIKT